MFPDFISLGLADLVNHDTQYIDQCILAKVITSLAHHSSVGRASAEIRVSLVRFRVVREICQIEMDVKTLFPSFCQCFPRWLCRRCWRFSEGLGSACCYFWRVGWASENVTWLAEPARAGSRWVLSPTHRDCDGISRSLAALPAALAWAHTLAPWQVQGPYHQQLETQNCLFYNFHIPCLFWYLAFKYCQWETCTTYFKLLFWLIIT